MTSKPDASNAFVRALLTFIGEEQELRVRGVEPGELRGKKVRAAIIEEFKSTCVYCEKKLSEPKEMQLDHLISMNRDNVGLQIYGNLVLSCPPCNSAKKDRDFGEFLRSSRPNEAKRITKRLVDRQKRYGADLDVNVLKELAQKAYAEIGRLLDKQIDASLALLAQPKISPVVRGQHDFTAIAALFPMRSKVETTTDNVFGEVVGYSMQGPKGSREARVRFELSDGTKLIRARSNLRLTSSKPRNA